MPLGLPICSTCSMGPKSTPRSRLDVATTHFILPRRSPSSAFVRNSRATEPWWRAIVFFHSGRAAPIASYHRSACERVLVNTSVVEARSIAATTCGKSRIPMCPAHGNRSIGSGIRVSISSRRGMRADTSRASAARVGPTRAATASSRLASVAERPHVTRLGRSDRSRSRASSVCTPRFVERSSCHSSTITVSSDPKISWESSSESRIESDSGVVTRAVGQLARSRRRSATEVSPVRTPIDQPRTTGFGFASGSSSARTVSAASALSGVTQTTRRPANGFSFTASKSADRAIAPSQAASVLPVPVGAWSTPLALAATARHTCS